MLFQIVLYEFIGNEEIYVEFKLKFTIAESLGNLLRKHTPSKKSYGQMLLLLSRQDKNV